MPLWVGLAPLLNHYSGIDRGSSACVLAQQPRGVSSCWYSRPSLEVAPVAGMNHVAHPQTSTCTQWELLKAWAPVTYMLVFSLSVRGQMRREKGSQRVALDCYFWAACEVIRLSFLTRHRLSRTSISNLAPPPLNARKWLTLELVLLLLLPPQPPLLLPASRCSIVKFAMGILAKKSLTHRWQCVVFEQV